MAILVNFGGLENASTDINTTKKKFDDEMETLTKTVEETTQNDWKGPDAIKFVSVTKAKLNKLQTEYNEFFTELENAINDNHDAFKETQQHNINSQGD